MMWTSSCWAWTTCIEVGWLHLHMHQRHQPMTLCSRTCQKPLTHWCLCLAIPELQGRAESLTFAEQNILAYIAGYIIRKVRRSICDVCVVNITTNEKLEHNSLIDIKRYTEAKDGLISPSTQLLHALCSIEQEYRRVIDNTIYNNHVKASLLTHLESNAKLESITCQACNVHKMVLHIMINIRLHHTLRESNRSLLANKDRKNRKVLKFSHL